MNVLTRAPIRLRALHHIEKPVSWLELFFDLVFVAAVAQVGTPLGHDYTFAGLARYAFLFFLIWWAWLGHSMFNTRFLVDDSVQRILTLVQIFATAVMAANARDALSSRDSAGFAAAYAVVRLVLAGQYLRVSKITGARSLAILHAIGFGSAALIWLGAAFVPTPLRFWLWGFAFLIDVLTPGFSAHRTHRLPPDATHLPERFGLFTIILLGESVMAIMRGIESQENWPPQAALSAIFGLCIVFAYWWWYFDHSGAAEERRFHSPRHTLAFQAWLYVHFPLYLSIAVAGIGVEHIISLHPGERFSREGTVLLACATCALMLSLVVIAQASRTQSRRKVGVSLILPALALLPTVPFVYEVPPFLLLAYVLFLCTLQNFTATSLTSNPTAAPVVLEQAPIN
jgi:low temperature requirement protein LtrA